MNAMLDPQTPEGALAVMTPEESAEYESWLDSCFLPAVPDPQ